jgi:hypothetical protein
MMGYLKLTCFEIGKVNVFLEKNEKRHQNPLYYKTKYA